METFCKCTADWDKTEYLDLKKSNMDVFSNDSLPSSPHNTGWFLDILP